MSSSSYSSRSSGSSESPCKSKSKRVNREKIRL